MNELVLDIHSITNPIVNNYIITLEELISYTVNVLTCIYDKKFIKKHIYKEYIKQLICMEYKDKYGYIYNNFKVIDHSDIVEYIKTIPQFEQRTTEWFNFRKNNIGASESAAIFGKSIFSNEKKLLLKKCGHETPYIPNPACIHGTKYEPVIQLLYQIKNNTVLYEFGSIAHHEYPMISASPDGITETGVMVEIKAPYKRKITSIPPIYYWYQMQQQLQVCNLDRVDFVECNINEYLNKKMYINDYTDEINTNINKEGNFKGIILEFFKYNGSEISTDWIYPKKFLLLDEIDNWIEVQKNKMEVEENKNFSRIIYYKIDKYSCCQVWRDDNWWNNNKNKYVEFWNKVIQFRKSGIEKLLPKKKPRKKRKIKCLIED